MDFCQKLPKMEWRHYRAHWNVFNIPVDGSEKDIKGGLPNGKIAGSYMGTDQKGKNRYKGMCPPNGKTC